MRFPWVLLMSVGAPAAGLFGVTWYSSLEEGDRLKADGLAEDLVKKLAGKRQNLLGQAGSGLLLPPGEDFSR